MLDQALLAEAEAHAPQAGQPLDIGLAVLVEDVNALAAGQDQRPLGLVHHAVGVGMQVIGDVAGRQRVGQRFVHRNSPRERFGGREVRIPASGRRRRAGAVRRAHRQVASVGGIFPADPVEVKARSCMSARRNVRLCGGQRRP